MEYFADHMLQAYSISRRASMYNRDVQLEREEICCADNRLLLSGFILGLYYPKEGYW